MNLKQVLCFHSYKVAGIKSNFYGEATLLKCGKCGKEKVDVIGWPELGLVSTYKHFDENGKELK